MGVGKGDIAKFIKFALTGVLNTAVDAAVFTAIVGLGKSEYLAQAIGYACGMLCSYIVNRRWTFSTKDKLVSLTAVRFLTANLCLLFLSLGVVYLAKDLWSFPTLITKSLATCCTICLGFFINRIWVFRDVG